MGKLIRVADPEHLSFAELCAIEGRDISTQLKWKGEVTLLFRDKDSGEIVRRRDVLNTRTNVVRQLWENSDDFMAANTTSLFIANDDGAWHFHKNVIRATYENNSQNYFRAATDGTINAAINLWNFQASFQAPITANKTINVVGVGAQNGFWTAGNWQAAVAVVAATVIPGGEIQTTTQVLDVTYKVTLTE